MTSITRFQQDIFYELLLLATRASWSSSHACVLFKQNKIDADLNEAKFKEHSEAFYQQGRELGISEKVLHHIQWGAWHAAWWTASRKSRRFYRAFNAKRLFDNDFLAVINSDELDYNLAEQMKWAIASISWYCSNAIHGNYQEGKSLASKAIIHCLKVCPDCEESEIRKKLDMPPEEHKSSVITINVSNPNHLIVAEAAADIQQLLQQLEQTNPTSTTTEQMVVATKAIEEIENNPTLKQRIINAAKEGGLAALEKALDNPVGAFITSAIKGWLEAEAQ